MLVDGGRRCMGTEVSIVCTIEMFGWVTIHRNIERISGSDSGYSPAPPWVYPNPVASVMGLQFSG